jgi:dienelactone hydrolase
MTEAHATSTVSQAQSLGHRIRRLVAVGRREVALVQAGLLVVGVHVLDDTFLQPQPGTSAADHLVSGLVPLAVLVAAGAFFARLRPGLRASLLAALGLFGVVSGVEGVYYLHAGKVSGDDYTGMAAIPAGLFLIAVAVATLWRSRRTGDNLAWRWVRRALLSAAAVIGTYLLVAPLLMAYVLTHTARAFVPDDRVGAAHEEVSFTTNDGLRLRGWYVPSRNGAAVISFPGRKGTQKPARMLARHGYGVLLFDRRGEGESDGDPNAWGWNGYRDVEAAVRFLRARPDIAGDRIGGIGLSVGGEMMLEAAAKSRGLKAVVSEGAGERSVNEFLDMARGDMWLALPQYVALTTGTALFSGNTPPQSLTDLVGRIAPTPVFFVYGEHGQDGERTLNPKYYAAARQPKQLWEVPGAGHVGGIKAQPVEYERRVIQFFDRTLLPETAR